MTRLFDEKKAESKEASQPDQLKIALSLYQKGRNYLYGLNNHKKNVHEALEFLFQAAEKNKNPYSARAFNELKKLVDFVFKFKEQQWDAVPFGENVKSAANKLGACYARGFGTQQNLGLAKELWTKTGFINSEDYLKEENDNEEDASSTCVMFPR